MPVWAYDTCVCVCMHGSLIPGSWSCMLCGVPSVSARSRTPVLWQSSMACHCWALYTLAYQGYSMDKAIANTTPSLRLAFFSSTACFPLDFFPQYLLPLPCLWRMTWQCSFWGYCIVSLMIKTLSFPYSNNFPGSKTHSVVGSSRRRLCPCEAEACRDHACSPAHPYPMSGSG